MNVHTNIAVLDEFGNDEDPVIGSWCSTQTQEKADVRVPTFFHEAPLALKVLPDIVFVGGQHLLDSDVDTKIYAPVNVPKRPRAQLLPIALDVLWAVSGSNEWFAFD